MTQKVSRPWDADDDTETQAGLVAPLGKQARREQPSTSTSHRSLLDEADVQEAHLQWRAESSEPKC